MLRSLIRVSHNLANVSQLYKYGSGTRFVRHFSGELIAGWPDSIKTFLENEKINSPTLIQEKTLPIVMENKDLVGIARTGSGKTLAFVIPAVLKIMKERENSNEESSRSKEKSPSCVILAPTRELASQTADVFKKFNKFGIRSIVLVGGASRQEQIRSLSYRDQDVYIATPGRLKDLVESEIVDLSKVKYLVLDEADRMLDMGFEPQIRQLLKYMPNERQTLMWSATWPQEIQDLAEDFMTNYKRVAVDSEKLKANPNITQIVDVCSSRERLQKMLNYLEQFSEECDQPRTLIFTNTKRLADQIMIQLMRNKYRTITMHGDRSQAQRDNALRLFKNRSCNIMVATDVAARGLDIDDITHVINYDFPNNIEDYIHRIGRTARHDKSGKSISLFTPDNASLATSLIKVLEETNQEVPHELVQLSKQRIANPTVRGRNNRNNFFTASPRRNSKSRLNIYDMDDEEDYSQKGSRATYDNDDFSRRRSRAIFDD